MSNVSWVITIVDPDAPTPQNPNNSQFLHFIGQDFKVDTASRVALTNVTGLTNHSQALVEFFPPSPPAGSDPHRYVVLVYVQPDNFNTTALAFFNGTIGPQASFRNKFNITNFATNTSLGNPIAGNFFLVGPGNTTASPVPSNTSPSATIFSQPPSIGLPTVTGATDTTSGAEKAVGSVLLVVAGALSVALGLLV